MLPGLKIVHAAKSRLGIVDVDKVAFGDSFSDHMFSMTYDGGRWGEPTITPYGPVLVEPAAIAIQYAQTVFEGLKVYRAPDRSLRLFRPDRNAARLRASSGASITATRCGAPMPTVRSIAASRS